MAAALLPEPLWDLVEPFLPTPPRRPKGGRPRVSDRACLTGILFVLRSGIPWPMLPQELGCGSGMTCWRRLRDWQSAGMWDLIHFAALDWLARYGRIDWSRTVVDSCSIRAVYGGDQTGPNPTDRAKRGSKRHLICDGRGVPLAVRLTGANRNDSQEALALVDAIPPLHRCARHGDPPEADAIFPVFLPKSRPCGCFGGSGGQARNGLLGVGLRIGYVPPVRTDHAHVFRSYNCATLGLTPGTGLGVCEIVVPIGERTSGDPFPSCRHA